MTRWPTVQLRHLARCLDGRRVPLNAEQRAELPGDYPYWGANGVVDTVGEYLFDETIVLLGEDGAPFGDRTKDVAFLVHGRVWVNNHIHVLRPSSRADARFMTYALNVVDWPAFISGSTRDKLTQEDMNRAPVSCPPLPSQGAIADYLDAETARIDALITKKQRMIELLGDRFWAEGRALVTGGCPKDGWSPGHPWAGPVPKSWRPLKIGAFARLGSGTTPSSDIDGYYAEGGLAWVTTAELRETVILVTARGVTERALRECSALKVFPAGTVLVAMYGATVGRVGILGIPATTNQACCAIYGTVELGLPFLYWWLVLNRQNLLDLAYGAGQPNISQETIRALRVPAPGLDEQQAIVSGLEMAHEKLSANQLRLERQIDLLRERRQALITAAVTGELEVPGVAV